MDLNLLKENILESKLNLHRIQLKKKAAVKNQHYAEAAQLREQEKLVREHIEKLKSIILKSIHTLKSEHGNLNDYALVQSLLFEFHSIDFKNDNSNSEYIEAIDNYVNHYWKIREQLQEDLMNFLSEEYQHLKGQMLQFNSEADNENAQSTLSRLKSISEIIQRQSH
jgi:hypothetical protein